MVAMKFFKIPPPSVLALVALLALGSACAHASDGVWNNGAGGSWTNAGNWTAGVIAGGSNSTANFTTLTLPANTTVTLDGARTVGRLLFDDQNAPKKAWTLNTGGAGLLTLAVPTGTPIISNNAALTLGAVLA